MINFNDLENSFFRNFDKQPKIEKALSNDPAENLISQELTPLAKWLKENSAKNYTNITVFSKKTEADFLREQAVKNNKNLDEVEQKIRSFNLEKDKRVIYKYKFDNIAKGENLTEYWNRQSQYLVNLSFDTIIFYNHIEKICEFKNT
jgi:hypothetical protein